MNADFSHPDRLTRQIDERIVNFIVEIESFRGRIWNRYLFALINMIDTERLVIKPLTPEQLRKYIVADNSLELELNLNPAARTISPELREALERDIIPNLSDPCKNYLFYTLWTIILKEENRIIGDLCFCGEPNSDGEIEIGYGTYKEYRKRGFMTEAVGEMIKWAERQSLVKAITASTEKSNIDSHSVLEKNNFIKSGETDTLYKWKLEIA